MKSLRSLPALGAFFVLVAIAAAGCGSGLPGDSVADVAGNPITVRALNHWMFVVAKTQVTPGAGTPVIVPTDPPNFTKCIDQVHAQIPSLKKTPDKTLRADCKQLFTSLSAQVMDFLIKAYWYQADAHRLGIKVSDTQVQKTLAADRRGQLATAAQFNAFLASSGETLSDILFRVRVQLIYAKLLAKHPTTVTPAMISSYYSARQSQFGTPETRDMRIALTKTAAQAATAKAALAHGQSWTAVAKKYSIDPTTKHAGGLLSNVTAGQQDAALSQAAFAASVNKLLGPIKGQFGYYVVEVTKITPAVRKSLTQSSASIKSTLATQLSAAAAAAVTKHAKQNWLKQTTCRTQYKMADCSGYVAPKTTAATGAAGAATTAAP